MATIPMKWYNKLVSVNTILKILVTLTNALIDAFSSEVDLEVKQAKEKNIDGNS